MGQKSSTAVLIIDRGAKLVSQGTVTNPVQFTSDQQPGYRAAGDWNGITVLGYATNNTSNSITLTNNRDCSVTGGGTNDNDNSGTYKFMRIEYPIYGLSMVSVGDGTEFHDVQVSYPSENALELYGGKVNFKNFASLNAKRYDILATHGNRSKAQFILGVRLDLSANVSTSDLSNGIVFSNNDDAAGGYASSMGAANNHPVFSNVTLIGPKYCGATSGLTNFKNGILFRNNTEGGIYNSVVAGWPNGIFMNGSSTIANANSSSTIKFDYNSLYDYATSSGNSPSWTSGCETTLALWLNGSVNSCAMQGNQIGLSVLGYSSTVCGNYCSTAPGFLLGSTDLNDPNYDATDVPELNNVFFTSLDYRGAFDQTKDWTADWTAFCPQSTDYCPDQRRSSAPTGINNLNAGNSGGLVLAPNPVSGMTYAEFATQQSGKINISVINSVGQVVRTISKDVEKGKQRIGITTDGLSAGMYLINVELNKGNTIHSRVVVK
ncbi:MAG: T9SS type A sorting domain-containing protein [Sphingobacteriales bacterium]|nr:MAG: T9SS type A sorting domain-containing protein [Sphingobacteriales bacterium]